MGWGLEVLRAWVALGFLVSVSAFGQSELLLKSENALVVNKVECEAVGADLDISLNAPGSTTGAYIILKNFHTVINNSPNQVLKFKINDPSVGMVNVKNGGKQWEVLRAAAKDSACEVEITRETDKLGNKIAIALACRDLAPMGMFTLSEKSRQLLETANLNEKLSCTIRPGKR